MTRSSRNLLPRSVVNITPKAATKNTITMSSVKSAFLRMRRFLGGVGVAGCSTSAIIFLSQIYFKVVNQ